MDDDFMDATMQINAFGLSAGQDVGVTRCDWLRHRILGPKVVHFPFFLTQKWCCLGFKVGYIPVKLRPRSCLSLAPILPCQPYSSMTFNITYTPARGMGFPHKNDQPDQPWDGLWLTQFGQIERSIP